MSDKQQKTPNGTIDRLAEKIRLQARELLKAEEINANKQKEINKLNVIIDELRQQKVDLQDLLKKLKIKSDDKFIDKWLDENMKVKQKYKTLKQTADDIMDIIEGVNNRHNPHDVLNNIYLKLKKQTIEK